MKKRCTSIVFAVIVVIGTSVQTNTGDGLSLDRSIAQGLERGLPAGTRIAVVNLESPSARFSDFVLEELQGVLVNNQRLVAVDQSKLELLWNEINFQMSGEVSDESAISLGKFLEAQTLITVSLTDMSGAYHYRFNAVTLRNDRTIAYMLPLKPRRHPRKLRRNLTRCWQPHTSTQVSPFTRRSRTTKPPSAIGHCRITTTSETITGVLRI